MKKWIYVLVLLGILFVGTVVLILVNRDKEEGWTAVALSGNENTQQTNTDISTEVLPWEAEGVDPSDYTLEEYEALSHYQKECFTATFASIEEFEAWLESVQPTETPLPWQTGGIKPENYTIEAYEALSMKQKEAFKDYFSSIEAFEAWLEEKMGMELILCPWESEGVSPESYTYSQYEALSVEQKEAFIATFADLESFENWLYSVEPTESTSEETKGKPIEEYTWEEFNALSTDEKNAFIERFDSVEAFEAWMDEVQP